MRKMRSPDLRSKHREATYLVVELSHHGRQSVSCKALNLSVEGILLEIDGFTPATGALIDLYIRIGAGNAKIPAVVIHSNTTCTGVMFCKPQPDLYRVITSPMNHARKAITSRVPLAPASN